MPAGWVERTTTDWHAAHLVLDDGAAVLAHLGMSGQLVLPEPQTEADYGELLRTIGFSSAPGLIRVLGIIPGCLGAFTAVSLYIHKIFNFAALTTATSATAFPTGPFTVPLTVATRLAVCSVRAFLLLPVVVDVDADPRESVNIGRLAVKTGIWPLKEYRDGRVRHTKVPRQRLPVADYLALQGRFRQLFEPERRQAEIDAIQARVEGFLEGIHFQEGSEIEAGTLLYTLESQPFEEKVAAQQSRVAEAKTVLAKTKGDLDRIEPLAKVKAVSESDLDTAVADLADQVEFSADGSDYSLIPSADGNGNCTYDSSFVGPKNNLTVDLLIPALPDGGAHIFTSSLFVGETYRTQAELEAAGITRGGDGPTLTIEAGTTLAFQTNKDFIIVNRGSRILADGRADAPITFTSVSDINGTVGPEDVQQWGGIVINGFGVSNKCSYVGVRGEAGFDIAPDTECSIEAEGSVGDDESHPVGVVGEVLVVGGDTGDQFEPGGFCEGGEKRIVPDLR